MQRLCLFLVSFLIRESFDWVGTNKSSGTNESSFISMFTNKRSDDFVLRNANMQLTISKVGSRVCWMSSWGMCHWLWSFSF
jgi:hypothetical protein